MKKKVIIIDDEPDLIEVIEEIFHQEGWMVETAPNGRVAIEIISSFQPDVIFSDINMPDMDGIELLKRLNLSESEIPFVFLTAYRDMEKMQQAWNLCVFDFLDKPFDPKKLLQTAENALVHGKDYIRVARNRFGKNKKAA
jgi:DNA-binding NtrC family response regulator